MPPLFTLVQPSAPGLRYHHWYFRPVPVAVTLKVAVLPGATDTSEGWEVIVGGVDTVSFATLLVTLPESLDTSHLYW